MSNADLIVRLTMAERERDEALRMMAEREPPAPQAIRELGRERDVAVKQRDYWKHALLEEQADYDKARKERDALKETLDLVADLSNDPIVCQTAREALAGLEEA